MGSKKNRRQPASSPPPQQAGGPPWVLIGGVVVVAALAALALYPTSALQTEEAISPAAAATSTTTSPAPMAVAPQPATPKPPSDVPLPPLPAIPSLAPRPAEVIAEAYAFAGRNPDVLEFVPCFCGCERSGHRGNADCFVQSRNADGSVKSWDTHGMGCTVCIDVAIDSAQLRRSGASVRDVRSAIEAKYESRFPRKTPTPQPH